MKKDRKDPQDLRISLFTPETSRQSLLSRKCHEPKCGGNENYVHTPSSSRSRSLTGIFKQRVNTWDPEEDAVVIRVVAEMLRKDQTKLKDDRSAWTMPREELDSFLGEDAQLDADEGDGGLSPNTSESPQSSHYTGVWKTVARCVAQLHVQRAAKDDWTKSPKQCAQRWNRVLNPLLRKGAWTSEEDARLLSAAALLGTTSWMQISRKVHTRSDVQCRARWMLHATKNSSLLHTANLPCALQTNATMDETTKAVNFTDLLDSLNSSADEMMSTKMTIQYILNPN